MIVIYDTLFSSFNFRYSFIVVSDLVGHAQSRPVNTDACMLSKEKKLKVIKKFQTHEGDTGSSEVQIAILSAEVDELAEHLKAHAKDHSSRRGLLRKVGERRRLLRYLKKENSASYEDLVKKLKLKQAKQFVKDTAVALEGEGQDFEDETVTE
jgi:small subunit ribosomal protein S15